MKKLKYIISFLLTFLLLVSCEEDKNEIGDLVTPSNIQLTSEIVNQDISDPEFEFGDGSGDVNFTVTADDALSYKFNFGDNTSEVSTTGEVSHKFTSVGVNTYTVIVSVFGTGGITSTSSIDVEVFSVFDDPETKDFLSGGAGSSKIWYWAADKPVNIALGNNTVQENGSHTYPGVWSGATAFHADKLCMYDAEMVFTQDANGNLTFQQTVGTAYIPGTYSDNLGVDGDTCHGKDVVPSLGNIYDVALIASTSIATNDAQNPEYLGTTIRFSDDGFMSWYVGISNFEIISITETTLYVRVGQNDEWAWYCKFQTQNPYETDSPETLLWSDEFDVDGAPDTNNWGYDLGDGCPSNCNWGNSESQFYTNDSDNVFVSDGTLKIKAIKESISGYDYSSTRMLSQDKFEFTYGRVDVRAKLPEGGGTWPAIWMLGANFSEVGWPECGEIDIMEHVGNEPNIVKAAIHTPSSFGNTQNKGETTQSNVSSEWHVYSINWSEDEISFLVDDVVYYTYAPTEKTDQNWPFDKAQFLILNIAMGGDLGGAIDPAFTEAIMEIDYIRVYQ